MKYLGTSGGTISTGPGPQRYLLRSPADIPAGNRSGVDLRPHAYAKPTLDDPNFQDAVAALAATVHGKSKSDLVGEELRQQRKFTRVRNAVAAGLAVLLVLAIVMGIGFLGQRNTARSQRDLAVSRQLMAESTARHSADTAHSRLLAVAAARIAPESERDRANATLRAAIMDPGRYVLREQGQLSTVPAVGNGQIATARSDGSLPDLGCRHRAANRNA